MPTVVYHDPWLLAVDKPAGLLVHGDGTSANSLTKEIRSYLKQQGKDLAAAQAQPVQRLDVDTTGLVLFSLDKEVQPQLDALVAQRACHKRYLAMTAGAFPHGTKTISQPLGRDRHHAQRMRVDLNGKPSKTVVTLLQRRGNQSLVLVELHTGRKHQIRVHLAWLGYPLVGDRLYDGPASKCGLMLHAWQLEFVHPVTSALVKLQTAWPQRFGDDLENH